MNKGLILSLKALRKLHSELFNVPALPKPECINDADSAAQIIYDLLVADKPCMIARFGSTELFCLINYLGINREKNIIGYIKGKKEAWWWEEKVLNNMKTHSGFFTPTIDKIEQFCKLMLDDIPLVDILGSWLPQEKYFENELLSVPKIRLELLNPYFSTTPWTNGLESKTVLVIHPFAETIKSQYLKKDLIFPNRILPKFNLITIKAVQTAADTKTAFTDWFAALDFMKAQIDKMDYDICLIGAGAYGFPLAAHVKRQGKKAFHLGGSLQLLFGIKGKRWENPNYNSVYNYSRLMNDHWVKPNESEKPVNAKIIEGGCYW